MAEKNFKTKKQSKPTESGSKKMTQIIFAIFAILLIISMVLSAVTNF